MQYAAHTRHRCIPDLTLAWSRELSTSPFTSTPLITDVDADGELDIVATSFSGSIHVVQAKDGQIKPMTNWPYRLSYSSIHAGPLQYDINRDGMMDILICTSNGQIFFLNAAGELIPDKRYQLGKLSVDRDWYKKQLTVGQLNIHDFILDDPSLAKKDVNYVEVDAHVLATPVVDDLNQDGITEELVIPISYYFDLDDYSDPESTIDSLNVPLPELENYLVGGLVFLNLTSMSHMMTIHLDLTKISSEYPAYVLTTPTIADFIQDEPGLEVVIGTSAGHLHLINHRGQAVEPFPLPTQMIQTQVTVEDLNQDGELELIVQDSSGSVTCFDVRGQRLWETEISGSTSLGTRVTDMNDDGTLRIMLASDDGKFWALTGDKGKVVPWWPIEMAKSFIIPPLITHMHGLDLTILVSLSQEGILYMLSTDTACRHSFTLGETSLVPLASHDLLPNVPGVELLVATKDGILMCLMQSNVSSQSKRGSQFNNDNNNDDDAFVVAWPSETRTHNDFTFLYDKLGVWIDKKDLSTVPEYTQSTFPVTFIIIDSVLMSAPYQCQVLFGSVVLSSQSYELPGDYSLYLESPSKPLLGHLIVECRTKSGKILRDSIAVKFHTTFLNDLQWLLLCPTLATMLLLLFLYGFPAVDVLPVTTTAKQR